MDPPDRSGGMNLAPITLPNGTIICPRTTDAPRATDSRDGRRTCPSNTPDLVSRSRNLNRPSISDTANLGTGIMDIGSSTRSDAANPFGRWPRAHNSPNLASEFQNTDLPSIFRTDNPAHGPTAIVNTARRGSIAVPFSHWLPAPDTPSVGPEPRNLDRPAQSFINNSPPRSREPYVPLRFRNRTQPEHSQATVSGLNAPDTVSQPRNQDREAQSFIDTLPPRLRDSYVQRQTRDRADVGNGQPTGNRANNPEFVPQFRTPDRSAHRSMDTMPSNWRDINGVLRLYTENGPTAVNGPAQQADRDARASAARHVKAETFLETLPVLSLADLAKDSRECAICMDPYQTSPHKEVAVRLLCDHVIGKDCLLKWLKSSPENRHNNSCPICRTILFDRDLSSFDHRLRSYNDSFEHFLELSRPSTVEVAGIERLNRTLNRTEREQSSALIGTIDVEGIERRARTASERLGASIRTTDVDRIERRAQMDSSHIAALVRRANEADDRLIEMLERRGETARAQEIRARREQRGWI